MDSLITKELDHWKQDWIYDTSLYFPEGILIKYSPRTASQSLKLLLTDILLSNSDLNFLSKKRMIQNIKIHYTCDVKIAVKRDPVDRFISALNFDYNHWGHGKFANTMKCPNNINEVFESGWFNYMFENNKHYFPQTFYLQESKDYDLIFDINCLDNLVLFLNSTYFSNYKISKINSSLKHFQKEMLTDKHLSIIKSKYILDYENGWC